ncbi:MAG TPA: hypothetical protein VMV92_11155 [Streptosporangiaceae bacterium]|nr:hypothetical protein [Streptosporangiaceae bacterium]
MASVTAASRGFERDRSGSKRDSHRDDKSGKDGRRDRHDDGGEDSRDR